jgi:DNA-binding LacI/PurR family transcriptional regulator
MKISSSSGDPIYQQIKDALRAQIVSGRFKPGGRIPNETALAESLKVSRNTSRRAVMDLTTEGLLRRIPGRGTFVRDSLSVQPQSRACVVVASPYSPFTSPYYGKIMEGVHQAAAQSGTLIAFEYITGPNDVFLAKLRRHQSVKGVLMVGLADQSLRQQLLRLDIPVVLVDSLEPADQEPFDLVSLESEPGEYAAVKYLQQLGHQDIAFLGGDRMKGDLARRRQGYERAMREIVRKAPPELELDLATGFYPEAAYARTRRCLAERAIPTAIVCVSDEIAVAAISAIKDAGLRIPQDVSVIGFGDLGYFTTPKLATVRIPKESMGTLGMGLLDLRAAHPMAPPQRIALPVEFMAGASCDVPCSIGRPVASPVSGQNTRPLLPRGRT